MSCTNESIYHPGTTALFPFETNFDRLYQQRWMTNNWHLSIYVSAAYLFLIYAGQKLMATRTNFQLRKSLVVWNSILAIFSLTGALRSVPEMIYSLRTFGFKYSACVPSFAEQNNVTAFWAWAFALSKVPELIDTLFIILRKQKLIFLHYYHHTTVLLYCWFTYKEHPSMVRWFICLNYTVHALMYTYFALRAMRVKVPRFVAAIVTTLQIVQMVVGGVVCCSVCYYLYTGQKCSVPKRSAVLGVAMYGSYFALFLKFFITAYIKSNHSNELKKKQ